MRKQQICVNLEKCLVARIDQNRGDVPRSRVIEKILNAQMGNERTTEEKDGEGQ